MNTENERQYTTLNSVVTTVLLTSSFFVLFVTTTTIACLLVGFVFANTVLHRSGFTWKEVGDQVQVGLTIPAQVDQFNHKNILILGLDTLENRPGSKTLTDTLLLVSFNVSSGDVAMVSIPRDVWSTNLQAKINSAYAIAIERGYDPKQFVSTEVTDITGIPIHHTVVVTLDTLAEVVDTLGGVTVTVDNAFTDELFPRSDVDVSIETDPTVLYQTVTFAAGEQVLNGEKALQFVRSRHAIGIEGTDLARSSRQQKLVSAIVAKTISSSTDFNPDTLSTLGRVYKSQFANDLPISELIATAFEILRQGSDITVTQASIPVYPESSDGVIFHPPEQQYQGQWVYAVKDTTDFKLKLRQLLEYE